MENERNQNSQRQLAIEWWNNLPDYSVKDVLNTGKHGLTVQHYGRRLWQSLTEEEIEEIWRKQNPIALVSNEHINTDFEGIEDEHRMTNEEGDLLDPTIDDDFPYGMPDYYF
jgi:hypothetical protein